jgi:hypothetical protein
MVPLAAWTQQWLASWQRAQDLGRAGLAWTALFWDVRQLRSVWLPALSQTMDRQLRSEPFLRVMRHNVRALNVARLPFSNPFR